MPPRIIVEGPAPNEESRQIAEAVADLHYAMGTIVEGARELIPGESVDELTEAWTASEKSMYDLVASLTSPPPGIPKISDVELKRRQLTGDVGKIKRSTLSRLRDRFFMFWNSAPRNDEKRAKASDAASDYLEFGATVVSSVPGYEQVVEVLSLGKQLLGIRAKRGV